MPSNINEETTFPFSSLATIFVRPDTRTRETLSVNLCRGSSSCSILKKIYIRLPRYILFLGQRVYQGIFPSDRTRAKNCTEFVTRASARDRCKFFQTISKTGFRGFPFLSSLSLLLKRIKKIGVKKKSYSLLDGGKKGRGGRKKAVKKKKKKKKSTVNTLCLYPDGIFLKGGRALVEGRRKKEGAKYRVKITSLRGCRNGERERGGRV